MKNKTGRPETIDEYIADYPKPQQTKLKQIRKTIKKAAPGATEAIKWGSAAFSYKRILVIFAGHKNHIGFYPTPSAMKAYAKEISKFKTGKGSIQFPYDEKLPLSLITKITKFRVKESLKKDKKWMPKKKKLKA